MECWVWVYRLRVKERNPYYASVGLSSVTLTAGLRVSGILQKIENRGQKLEIEHGDERYQK